MPAKKSNKAAKAKDGAKPPSANRNGKKAESGSGSFFTWFIVLALLGVWTSVAVVYFDLVDYQGVVDKARSFHINLSEALQGRLVAYDADGDGDFDVDDAKVLLDEKPGGETKRGGKRGIMLEVCHVSRVVCVCVFVLTIDCKKNGRDNLPGGVKLLFLERPLLTGCSIGHKPCLLNDGLWVKHNFFSEPKLCCDHYLLSPYILNKLFEVEKRDFMSHDGD
uniref:Aspartyl beta-hydroxylase/Triadin domain-containing protein n=1 Tax=Gouania willdenowi TaxID=441366 RepID=A0A8C5N596_GOUWI